jgi:hypothetical protein
MNVHILKNAMAVQRRNDQKVTNHARAKTQREWNKLKLLEKKCPFPKLTLVKLASK